MAADERGLKTALAFRLIRVYPRSSAANLI